MDTPILDVYAYPEPWQVPRGTLEKITKRAKALMDDPRADGQPEVVRDELSRILDYLLGIGGVRSGSRVDIEKEILGSFFDPPRIPKREPATWGVACTEWRPPHNFDLHAPEWYLKHRQDAIGFAEECVRVFEPLVPLRDRLKALLSLYAKPAADHTVFPKEQRTAWAAAADDRTVQLLPELAGPISHLGWVADGLVAAHEYLRAAIPEAPEAPIAGLSGLLRALGQDTPPVELTAALGDRAAELLTPCEVGSAAQWTKQTRSWLARAVAAGHVEAARTWVDMAVRFVCAVKGLPNDPVDVDDYLVQVGGFTFDRVRLTQTRRATENPIAARLAQREQASGGSDGAADAKAADADELDSALIGQEEAVAALRSLASRPKGQLKVLISGPDGTGKHDLTLELARLMRGRGLKEDPLWISDAMFARQPDAVSTFHKLARECVGERLLVIENLDLIALDPQSGGSLAEELHRLIDVYPRLHVVALTEQGGDEQVRRVNPAIMQRLELIHTRPFDEHGYAELFTRAVQERGGTVTRPAAVAAGELLVRTAPYRNLRNARLAHRLAETVLRRHAGADSPVVRRPDIPAPGAFLADANSGDPLAELRAMIGIDEVKEEVDLWLAQSAAAKRRREHGIVVPDPVRHLVLTGNPGTGKTQVARLIAQICKNLGVLSSGHLVEVSRVDLVADYVGQTAAKTRRKINEAIGGVLFIDEAYALIGGTSNDYGPEAISELIRHMEDSRDELIVIVAGYESEMHQFLAANPGLASRFPTTLRLPDYSDDQLLEILAAQARSAGLNLGPGVREKVGGLLLKQSRGRSFGNARLMRNVLDRAMARQVRRLSLVESAPAPAADLLLAEDFPETLSGRIRTSPPGDPLKELAAMVGLDEVKKEVRMLAAGVQAEALRREAGLPVTAPARHMVFTGNPGTGKTVVARVIAEVYAQLGLLSSGHLVEASRADLVAGYVGQTAAKVAGVVRQALGGVLFIDEAYALTPSSPWDFGQEAVATLLKLMEDNRGDLIVIVAGYEAGMAGFLVSNPGLASRFPVHLAFPDYDGPELAEIFATMAEQAGLTLDERLRPILLDRLRSVPRDSSFGNARLIRNALERTVARQALRITDPGFEGDVALLLAADLPDSLDTDRGPLPGMYL
ncbi:AAA family ATPase [Actinospica sp.]|uniref:AAA family ATPase n=1 Tax=Actinospica sp. TaxID=1872142 RepID=UPI002CE0C1BC|nr:AAA family ATPase [Actinospica sp.]HWG22984.1 AAA family ATPase [Actinospica sp.]